MSDVSRSKKKFALAALPPLLILLALPLKPLFLLAFGTKVTLAARPADPREIFRGDYVALSFEVESLPLSLFDAPRGAAVEETVRKGSVWRVEVTEGADGVWKAARAVRTPPDGPYLEGRVTSLLRTNGHPDAALMDYGTNLRRYYVREGAGRSLEKEAQSGGLLATVRLFGGEAVIESVSAVPSAGSP